MDGLKRILIVDDDPSNRNLIANFLEADGHSAESASDGFEALEMLKSGFDLVLMDVMMPGMDGFEAVRHIRENSEFSDIPVIMVTVLDDKQTRIRAVQAGANDFINKPIDRLELSVRIESLLKMKDAQDAIKRHQAELEETVQRRTAKLLESNERLTVELAERKKAELALRSSEERFRTLFETARDAIFLMDGEKFIQCNTKTLQMFGCEETEDIVGHTPMEFSPDKQPDGLDSLEKALKYINAASNSNPHTFYWKHCRKDGSTFDAEVSLNALTLNSKVYLQAIVRNITDSRRLEQNLRESEEKYRLLVEKALEGIVVAQDGLIRFVNVAALTIVGYDEEEVLFKPFTEFIHPDDRDMVLQRHLRRMKGEKFPSRYSFRIISKDGQVKWVEIDTGQIVWENKPAVLFFMTDITERKQAQERIEKSERRFRLLLEDVSSVPVQGYDNRRGVVFWNSASEKLYGYSRDEALGKQLEDLIIPPHMRDEVITAVDNWLKNGQRIPSGEYGLMRKDGSIVPVYSSHVMLEDSKGQKEMYCVDLDLTDMKRGEEDRTALRDQLFQAQKMEAIGNLAGGIAHDFNNILQVVLGFSQVLLQQKKEGEADYSRIEKIYNAGKRGSDLVKSLMTFSRQSAPMLRPTDLNHEILQVRDLLSHTIPKTINIDLKLAEALKSIQADRSQLGQILMNLAINARDAMPDGGTLTIETGNIELDDEHCSSHPESKPGSYVLLTVTDTGQGMDKETLAHIFEPFFTTKEVGKGTGLGLATVYGIVKLHKSHITCISDPGLGTTFKVYLPSIQTKNDLETPVSQTAIPGGTETVLLVDDDDDIRDLGIILLNEFGYKVITAGNGKEALEIYQNEGESISLVILDLIMPLMDGKKCLEEILLLNPNAKVIIASGVSEGGSTNVIQVKGGKGYVQKPYNMRQFLTAIREVLDNDLAGSVNAGDGLEKD